MKYSKKASTVFTNRKYRELFNVSDKTALRELSGFISKGFISKKGKFKDKEYFPGGYASEVAGKIAGKILLEKPTREPKC